MMRGVIFEVRVILLIGLQIDVSISQDGKRFFELLGNLFIYKVNFLRGDLEFFKLFIDKLFAFQKEFFHLKIYNSYIYMQPKQKHQPQRFTVYILDPDGQGFTLEGNDRFFKFDQFMGWYDQFGNYYDADGVPAEPPQSSCSSSEDSYFSESEDSADSYEKEFGKPEDVQDSDEDEAMETKRLEAIAENTIVLDAYPLDKPLRVEFENNFLKKRELFELYQAKVKGILNVVSKKQAGDGNGYFVLANSQAAHDLIKLEGVRVGPRQLYFEVESIENLLMDPLTEKELALNLQEPVNKYILKEKKEQEAKQARVGPAWKWYSFQKKAFPSQSLFKEWMMQNGFNVGEDFSQIRKIPKNKEIVRVELSQNAFKILNGLTINENKVIFTPLE